MSYSEQDGQVVLTMSREDYETILLALGAWTSVQCETWYDEETRTFTRIFRADKVSRLFT